MQGFPLGDLNFWTGPEAERDDAFRRLRDAPGLTFIPHRTSGPAGGFWAVTRYDDVIEISRRPEDFCSGEGVRIATLPDEVDQYFDSIIGMDDPRHARMRRIVSHGFTPRTLATLNNDVERITNEAIDDIARDGSCDFVEKIAALIPLRVILDLMGIPRSFERFALEQSNVLIAASDPDIVADQSTKGRVDAVVKAGHNLAAIIEDLARDRQTNPLADLTTVLVNANVDGESLTPGELGSFFIILVVAGNETTRNAIAHGLRLLSDNPDQRALWQGDFERVAPTAVEEIVRLATPVIHMRRTVTRDGVRLGDHVFERGDRVVLWYNSANRDSAEFPDPDRFDVARTPNYHVGFGGPGPHFCLGAHLARREVTITFRELFRRLPDIHAVGAPDRIRSNFINGIKHLRADFTPAPGARVHPGGQPL